MRARVAVLSVVLVTISAAASSQHPGMELPPGVECRHCHAVERPEPGQAPLRSCPHPESTEDRARGEADDAPDVFILDSLSEVYVPVVFPHKLHAFMAGMGTDGCATCHHHTQEGRITRCGTCHGGPDAPVNLRRPSLKGAYHRQCLSCHREWSHETGCIHCHAKREPDAAPQEDAPMVDDVTGAPHPRVHAPTATVYTVEGLEEGPIVTFNHHDHVDAFGLRCVDCHQRENCGNCHDTARAASGRQELRADPHEELCGTCHAAEVKNECAYCHTVAPHKRFNHARDAEFLLKPYHATLQCRACHARDERRFTSLPKECAACHGDNWPPKDFAHDRVGVALDAVHAEASCMDCHVEGFERQVRCGSCHELEWEPGEFDHRRTGEPLDEDHLTLDCTDCHVEGLGKPASCTG
ncbi:MAG TPA: cytochrome c3 family protein, partial [Candidatus Hydrogenedentes bacterium]|nr:cytochrome c3 family protein [Candidatus Hydrogenedentota bacterium]